MNTDIQRLHPGPRLSEVVIHNGTVYLKGQVGAPGASAAEQTKSVLDKIDLYLAEAGSHKSRILSAQIWLADMADFAEMNSVWDLWVDPANPPARATGQVTLGSPQYKVEIIIVAAQHA